MRVISKIGEMQGVSRGLRKEGKIIAFVPTMGFLHQGHIRLMEEGKNISDCLVTSIFVNPTQFGPSEDYEGYPRNFTKDKKLSLEAGIDIIFIPSVREMYPPDFQTFVRVEKVTQNLCGISRPTHFQGVTTVVAKLFNIIKPHIAVFGNKDFQQLITIKRMAKDLNFDIKIIGVPTVREKDGLAMSSRNNYLNSRERKAALALPLSLKRAENLFNSGEKNAEMIIKTVKEVIEKESLNRIEYVKICNSNTMEDMNRIDKEVVLALAVRVGNTRLIDNLILNP